MDLVITFPDQSASFVNGVEYGRLLEKMERGDDHIKNNGFPVHIENIGLIERTCRCFGYVAVFGEVYDGWVDFIGVKKTTSDN